MSIVLGYDVTHQFIDKAPKGQLAGYVTGSPDIMWTAADWAAHPGAVRIDQSPVNTALDESADVLDVEKGAATFADCAPWAKAALANFACAARQGQRRPAIYMSASNVTNVANALVAGGVTSGVGLWVADWNLTQAQAVQDVLTASGPFPVVAVQFTDSPGFYDVDVFSGAWLADQSHPDNWTYGPPLNLAVRAGRHNFHATWEAPHAPEPPAFYLVHVYRGTTCNRQTLVPSYPRTEEGPFTHPDPGGLRPSTQYTLHVSAFGLDGAHARPFTFASTVFTTARPLL